jgi:hypothetical protein
MGEVLAAEYPFGGSSRTYHQVLPLCESPLAGLTCEIYGASRASARGLGSWTAGTHFETVVSLIGYGTSLVPVTGLTEVTVDDDSRRGVVVLEYITRWGRGYSIATVGLRLLNLASSAPLQTLP